MIMDSRQFFAAVCKLRKLQKHRDRYPMDDFSARECAKQEDIIDAEIKRVDAVLREKAQPRFFDI